MSKIRLKSEEIKCITLFENLTGAKVKDCVQEKNTIGFLVDRGNMGLAIGRKGSNINRVIKTMGKRVIVVEFLEDLKKFIRNLFQPVNVKNARISNVNGEKIAIIEINRRDRSKIIGADGVRIKIAKKMAKRHFGVDNIKLMTS